MFSENLYNRHMITFKILYASKFGLVKDILLRCLNIQVTRYIINSMHQNESSVTSIARAAERFARVEDTCWNRVQAFELAKNFSPVGNRLLYLNYAYISTSFL